MDTYVNVRCPHCNTKFRVAIAVGHGYRSEYKCYHEATGKGCGKMFAVYVFIETKKE